MCITNLCNGRCYSEIICHLRELGPRLFFFFCPLVGFWMECWLPELSSYFWMKFNPYSWSDSSSPKGSTSVTKTKVCLCRTIPSLFLYYFHKYRRGKIGLGKKKLLTWLLVLVFVFVFVFFWGGGGCWTVALGNFEILESYRFFINPELLCGNREGVLGKSC